MASAARRRASHRARRALRPAAAALLLAVVLAATAAPSQARAAERARVCGVYRAPVLNRRWVRITTSHELRGWIRARYLCRR